MTALTEAQFQHQIIDLAQLCGWLVHHTRPARRADGTWSTPIQGNPGFPDLVLAHPTRGRVILAELKSARGRLTEDQKRWGLALGRGARHPHSTHTYHVWFPDDWPTIEAALRFTTAAS